MCVENQCRGIGKVKGDNSYRCLLQKMEKNLSRSKYSTFEMTHFYTFQTRVLGVGLVGLHCNKCSNM